MIMLSDHPAVSMLDSSPNKPGAAHVVQGNAAFVHLLLPIFEQQHSAGGYRCPPQPSFQSQGSWVHNSAVYIMYL